MIKNFTIFVAMLVTLIIGIPIQGYSGTTGKVPASLNGGKPKPQISVTIGQPRRRWRENGRWYYGYRNYGQFRRTQVGRYRYRMFPEYYWDGGVRRVRHVRYYYNY